MYFFSYKVKQNYGYLNSYKSMYIQNSANELRDANAEFTF